MAIITKRVIEKDTGKIRVVLHEVLLPGNNRVVVCKGKTFKLSDLGITWDYVDYDYSKYSKNIINLLKSENPGYLEIIAKRFHPGGYFNEGDIVFFNKPCRYMKDTYGPDYPFIITEITNGNTNSNDPVEVEKCSYYFRLGLKVYRGFIPTEEQLQNESKYDVLVDYSLLEFYPSDAFHILSRYDTEY